MKATKLIAGGLIASLALSVSSAFATESGFYVGLNLGQSTFDVEDTVRDSFGTTAGLDDSDTAWSLAFGYRFVPYFGVEAAYLDMGEMTFEDSGRENAGGGAFYEYSYSTSISLNGPAVSLVAAVPMQAFEFNAKLGVLFAKTELKESLSETLSVPGFPVDRYSDSFSDSSSTTETLYGLGAGYTFGDHFHVRLDWTMIPDAGDEDELGEDDVSSLTVGFQYRF